MVKVKVTKSYSPKEYELNFEDAMRNFKRLVKKDGTLQTLSEHMYYEKPSVKRKKKRDLNKRKLK